jgi:hypothetical protein
MEEGKGKVIQLQFPQPTLAQCLNEAINTANELVAAKNVLLSQQNDKLKQENEALKEENATLKRKLKSPAPLSNTHIPLTVDVNKLEIFQKYIDGCHLSQLEKEFCLSRRIISRMANEEGWKPLRQQVRLKRQQQARKEAKIDVAMRVTQRIMATINYDDCAQQLLFDVAPYNAGQGKVASFRASQYPAKKPYTLNKTGFRGVVKRRQKYHALISVPGTGLFEGPKQLFLGSFDTPEEAALRYDEAAKMLFGKNATLNFPE